MCDFCQFSNLKRLLERRFHFEDKIDVVIKVYFPSVSRNVWRETFNPLHSSSFWVGAIRKSASFWLWNTTNFASLHKLYSEKHHFFQSRFLQVNNLKKFWLNNAILLYFTTKTNFSRNDDTTAEIIEFSTYFIMSPERSRSSVKS